MDAANFAADLGPIMRSGSPWVGLDIVPTGIDEFLVSITNRIAEAVERPFQKFNDVHTRKGRENKSVGHAFLPATRSDASRPRPLM